MVFYRHFQYPQSGIGILTYFPFDEVVRLVYPIKPKILSFTFIISIILHSNKSAQLSNGVSPYLRID